MCGRYAVSLLERADWPVWLGETENDPAQLLLPSRAELRIRPVNGPGPGARDQADLLAVA